MYFKKCAALMLSAVLALSASMSVGAATYDAEKADFKEGVKYLDSMAIVEGQNHLGFFKVDMTGVKSVTIEAKCILPYGSNGDAVKIIADSADGEILGYVVINDTEKTSFSANIKEISGVHDIYIGSTYAHDNYVQIKSVTFNKEAYTPEIKPVADSAIIDDYHDTWAATDAQGRAVADFEEAGPVKDGEHQVGIMYWNWFWNESKTPYTIPKVVAEYPEAKDDYDHSAWDPDGVFYWGEPLLGYYSSYEYWTYRKHAEWLAAAGVDAIFLDYTNLDMTYVGTQNVLLRAFHDAREAGVNVPKISAYIFNPKYAVDSVPAFWFNVMNSEEYSDLVFKWEGKPLICGPGRNRVLIEAEKENDASIIKLINEIYDNIEVRENGSREFGQSEGAEVPEWQWLENYPLHEWGKKRSDGRVEHMVLGMAINHSYVYGYSAVGIMSNFDAKGRGYSEAFGEDYSADNALSATFMREQAAQILDTDPAFVYVDGWNELSSIRNKDYQGYENAFVDQYDDENSRDIEPVKGPLGDSYYNLLVDFVRKYKGVRPAPTAGSEATIDINGSASQWDAVTPEYISLSNGLERDAKLIGGVAAKTSVPNAIRRAKVARDGENIYFMAETDNDINTASSEFMHIYINTDRNSATGYEGYDFAFGREKGVLQKYENGAWQNVTGGEYTVSGKVMQVKIPRAALGLGQTVDLEFKWVDSAGEIASGDILDVYANGSSAPLGRFNYIYTEREQTSLTADERAKLEDTVVLAADKNKMIVDGAKVKVYEPDTRITPVLRNGTLYVPMDTIEEMMYGEAKCEYDAARNIVYVKAFKLVDREISDYRWTYTVLGSSEIRINGTLGGLTQPVIAENGMVYIPVTYLSDAFGWTVTESNGLYVLGRGKTPDLATAQSVANHLG